MQNSLVGDARDIAELADEYEIVAELGRGGSAVVYRARDRVLGREVAIKVVHPRPVSADDDPVARLAREARTVAQLQHQNIVTVYAVRRLRGGGLALVMQLVPGTTLKSVVQRRGPLPPEEAERVLRDVAEALAYAHARGVVHRDVKPENIFLDEDTGRALLSDFGIARSGEADSLTMTGTAIGTPFYMSPEQVEGGALDGRSDLYSLGLVAWEMLTGRRPWDGESLYNVIWKQKHEELPPIEALRPGVPPRLQYLVERMLQKRPAARWAGAEGLLVQLGRSVLPADYGKWQASLRPRIERWRAAEQARVAELQAAQVAAQRSTAPAAGSVTVRFPRTARREADGAADAEAPPGLGETLAFPLHDGTPTSPDASHPLDDGLELAVARAEAATPQPVEYGDVAEPSWDAGERPAVAPARVPRAIVGIGAAVAAGIALVAWRGRGDAPPFVGAADRVTTASLVGTAQSSRAAADGSGAADGRRDATLGHVADVLAVGGRHGCLVTVDAGVRCWGANERGQLGDGTDVAAGVPRRVLGDLSWVRVAAGSSHSCGVTRLGDVYCWGNDARGQLGDATTMRRTAPVRIAGMERYRAVRAGAAHSCALTTDGVVTCWGANDRGQLGDGTRSSRTLPARVRLPEGVPIREVAAGGTHSCALAEDGRLYCWGANTDGQLGDGGTADRPLPTAVAGGHRFASVSTGAGSTCGLTTAGTVLCWGRNADGELGTGDRRPQPAPVPVRLPSGVGAVVQVAAGVAHACALTATGEAWCWGRNAAGQLGDGTRTGRPLPGRVVAGGPFAALGAGIAHSCGVTSAARVLCWGANSFGQLGDSLRLARGTPAPVALPRGDAPAVLAAR